VAYSTCSRKIYSRLIIYKMVSVSSFLSVGKVINIFFLYKFGSRKSSYYYGIYINCNVCKSLFNFYKRLSFYFGKH